MDTGGFRDTRSHLDGNLVQNAQNRLDIETTDALAFEQLRDGGRTDACRLSGTWHQGPELQKPVGGNVVGEFEHHLRVIAPELGTDAIAQTYPLLLQLFGQTRSVA